MTLSKIMSTAIVVACTFALPYSLAQDDAQESPTSASPARIGTFDSRAVAAAYYRSPGFLKKLDDMRDEQNKAKTKGDQTAIDQWDADGRGLQKMMHQQVFGSASIANVLQQISADLPKIANASNVDLVVSQWEMAFRGPNVNSVDLTDQIVQLFNPDQDTLKVVHDLRKHAPVPLEQLRDNP